MVILFPVCPVLHLMVWLQPVADSVTVSPALNSDLLAETCGAEANEVIVKVEVEFVPMTGTFV